MPNTSKIPKALIAVAIFFILLGVGSAIDMMAKIIGGSLYINFGVLALFVGPGLLARKKGWRTCGMVLLWVGMILATLIGFIFILLGGPLDLTFNSHKIGEAPVWAGELVVAFTFVIQLWAYRVLVRPDVREIFAVTQRG